MTSCSGQYAHSAAVRPGQLPKALADKPPTPDEAKSWPTLSRAGTALKGFCRTNLFKRLESSGHAFVLSLERHVLRNFIFLHAIENDLPLPIGTQDMGLLDTAANDEDSDLLDSADGDDADVDPARSACNGSPLPPGEGRGGGLDRERLPAACRRNLQAAYSSQFRSRFKWLRAALFEPSLVKDLRADAEALMKVLTRACA